MPFRHVDQLSAWLDEAGIDVLELIGPDRQLRLERAGKPGQDAAESSIAERKRHVPGGSTVKAPIAGTLLLKHPMHDTPLVVRGHRICAGQTVALLQIGTLLVSVTAPQDGIVTDVLGQDGSLIGFGTEIVRLAVPGSETRHDD
jgi:acetyl-CoA carboxylase biotin carboxyl carrier protein